MSHHVSKSCLKHGLRRATAIFDAPSSGVIRLQYRQGNADIELLEVLHKVSRAAAAEQVVLAHLRCDTIYSVQTQTRGQKGQLTVHC